MSSQHPEQLPPAPLAAQANTTAHRVKGTTACTICNAIYTPFPMQTHWLRAQPIVLESAFMSTCHFCYRCRRPACPACWDSEHGLCADCDQETQLPFHGEFPPLQSTSQPIFATIQPGWRRPPGMLHNSSTAQLFICIQPGRFERDIPSSSDAFTTQPAFTDATQLPTSPDKVMRQEQQPAQLSQPGAYASSSILNLADYVSEQCKIRRSVPLEGKLWQGMIFFFSIALLAGVTLVLLSLLSPGVDSVIARSTGIDIRAVIAYLLLLIWQYH